MREKPPTTPPLPLPWAEVVHVATISERSPWTVRNFLRGEPVRSTSLASINDALESIGRSDLTRSI